MYDLPDAHSSDSSYDLRILEEMRAQREAQYARRKQNKSAENTPGRTPGRLTPGISQRILAYQPRSSGRLPQIESESEETEVMTRQVEREARDVRPLLTRALQSVTIEKDPQVTITRPVMREPQMDESFLQAVEDSPLSRKSSVRGTPASIQARRAGNRSDTWDLTGDLKDQLGFASTPAPSRHGGKLQFQQGSDGDDDTDMSLPLGQNQLQNDTSPERRPKKSSAQDPKTFRGALESLPANSMETPWKQPPRVTDSLDVLRQLARSVSTTPSPKAENAPEPPKRETTVPYSSRPPIKSEVDESETRFASALDGVSGNSSPLGASKKESPQTKASTQQTASRSSRESFQPTRSHALDTRSTVLETPLVTGAFIHTPATAKPKAEALPKAELVPKADILSQNKQQPQLPISEPKPVPLPKSAISSIVQRAKLPNTYSPSSTIANIGENTVNSLEDIMEVTSDSGIDTGNNTESMNTLELLQNLDSDTAPISQHDKQALAQLIEHNLATTLPFSQGLPPSVEEQGLIRAIVEARMKRTMKREVKRVMKESSAAKTKSNASERPANSGMNDESERKEKEGRSWPGFSILTPRKKGRMEEELQLQRMSEHVNTMHSRSRELKADMSRLEKKLITPATCSNCKKPVNEHARDCPALEFPVLSSKSTPLLWTTDSAGSRHLTGLGLTLLITGLWAFTEMVLIFIKCEPLYVAFLDTNYYGPFLEGSRPPFLLAKTLFDPITWIFAAPEGGVDGVLGWISGMASWLWRFLWHLWSDETQGFGFGDTSRQSTSNTVMRYAAKATEAVVNGAWGSMNDDEIL
jgi:hypothetical protein